MYQKILTLLEAEGPLSLLVLHEKLSEYSYKNLQDTVAQLLGRREGEEKKIYVKDYERMNGKGGLSTRILAVGNLPDAVRAPADHLAAAKRWRDKPENKARRLATDRNRQRNRKIAKQASKNVFAFMANPPPAKQLIKKHAALPTVRHHLVDDEEVVA